MTTLAELVGRFGNLRALVIGDAMLDRYLEGQAVRLCAEAPVPVVRRTGEERVPGGAANTATNLRALGADAVLLGLVGKDHPGTILRTALRERGVDDRWLVEDEAVSTLHKLRIIANGQYVVRFDEGETLHCSRQARMQLLAHLDESFPRCDLVVVSDYRYGVVSDELVNRLQMLRAARPCVLVVDSKELSRFRRAGATAITPNHVEARSAVVSSNEGSNGLAGASSPNVNGTAPLVEMERIGRRLLSSIDAQFAAITLAGDGVLLVDRENAPLHLPTQPVERPNDIGAGDSFAAAMALALAAGGSREQAARLGLAAAGITVAKPRTAVAQRQELLQRVSARDQVQS
ncbi:MAG TPA: PfkB family carbohydrate kinase [Ardenticatenaceae bacterium]|nr:PfkB family carbohydrate kinase [Ardenticatenaceae bacterium]